MTNKEINRTSGRIFESLLLPSWAFRSQEDQEDYGIDGEIEITTPEDKATGFIFKVQLKGTNEATYDAEGQLVFHKASVERFTYYRKQLSIPVLFVVCDVATGKCFWARVQGNRQIEAALDTAISNSQGTFTIKFPPSRIISKTQHCAGEIIEAVAHAKDHINFQAFRKVSEETFRRHIIDEGDLKLAEKHYRLLAGISSHELIRDRMCSGDFHGAASKAKSLLDSPSELPAVRVQAGVALVQAYHAFLVSNSKPNASLEAARMRYGVASKLLNVCRSSECEPRVRYYTQLYARSARMRLNGRAALALAVSEKTQRLQGSTLAGPFTAIQRIEASGRVARDFGRSLGIINRCVIKRQYVVIPYALNELAEATMPLVQALRMCGQNQTADAYVEAVWKMLPLSISIAKALIKDDDAVGILSSVGVKLVALGDSEAIATVKAMVADFERALAVDPPFARQGEVLAGIRDFVAMVEQESLLKPKSKPSMAEARAFYEQQAVALGIDLSDPNDRMAEIVRIGLEDLDPTRVARNCKYIHLRHGSYGIPAEMLGLRSAGSKNIICLKHGHSLQGFKLDELYRMFSQKWPWDREGIRCENCPDKTPHEPDWNWSEEWSAVQDVDYQKLVEKERSENEPES